MIGRVNIDEIMKHIPHRYPFVLIDGVEDGEANKWIRVFKNVASNESIVGNCKMQRHTMPDILLVEAFAQAAGVLCYFSGLMKPLGGTISFFASLDSCRFHRAVISGDRLLLHCEMARSMRGVVKLGGHGLVNGERVLTVNVTAVMRDRQELTAGRGPT